MLRHAVPIVAHFDWALAVTLAAREASVQPLVAPGLSLDSEWEPGIVERVPS